MTIGELILALLACPGVGFAVLLEVRRTERAATQRKAIEEMNHEMERIIELREWNRPGMDRLGAR